MKAVFGLIVVALALVGLYGWGENLVALVHMCMDPNVHVTPLLVLRVIGLFFQPLGIFLGLTQ